MLSDKELLELAAQAAGISSDGLGNCYDLDTEMRWNPLTDNNDAFRLMVQLRIDVEFWLGFEEVKATPQNVPVDPEEQPFGDDPYAATRRAIVLAAAEIGRTL